MKYVKWTQKREAFDTKDTKKKRKNRKQLRAFFLFFVFFVTQSFRFFVRFVYFVVRSSGFPETVLSHPAVAADTGCVRNEIREIDAEAGSL
jgi:hypothetical protein